MSFLSSHIIFQIYTTYMKTVQKRWVLNTALSIYIKIQKILSFLCQYHYLAQRWALFLKCHSFGIIRKLDVNQYIFQYTFNQKSAMTWELFYHSSFLKDLSLYWKNRIICLISSHVLTASRPTLTIVVIYSVLSYCQVFSSTYCLYILFLSIFFWVSVLSYIHCCQMTYAGCLLVIDFYMLYSKSRWFPVWLF